VNIQFCFVASVSCQKRHTWTVFLAVSVASKIVSIILLISISVHLSFLSHRSVYINRHLYFGFQVWSANKLALLWTCKHPSCVHSREICSEWKKKAQVEMILAPVINSPFYSCETKLMAFFLFTNCQAIFESCFLLFFKAVLKSNTVI